MNISTLGDTSCQRIGSSTNTHGSHALVQGGATEPSSSATPGPMAFFDKEAQRWKLDVGETNIDYETCYNASRSEHDKLLEAINKYSAKAKKPPFNLNAPHDWAGVEKSVQAACDAIGNLLTEDQAITGLRIKLQKGFKTLCQHAGAGQTFVSLIPSDAFGLSSLLCGALKIIFSAMQQSEAHSSEVYKALAELPILICDHSASCEKFSDDEQIHLRASELYASIFRLLRYIFKWYSRSSIVTVMRQTVNPSRPLERLKEKTAEVKLRAQDFRNRAMGYLLELQDKSVQMQYWLISNQVTMSRDVEYIRASIDQKLIQAELLKLLDPILQGIPDQVVRRLPADLKRPRVPKRHTRVQVAKLLEDFQYEQDLVFQDCHSLTNRLGAMSLGQTAETYLTAMQCSYQMRVFLTADEPSLLSVMGHCDPQPDSEISLLTAKIVERLFFVTQARDPAEKMAKIIPLVFFCGRHRNRQRDPYTNPTEVALSLLMQLIDHHRDCIDLEFLDRCCSGMKATETESVCCALKEIITNLGSNVTLVVIVEGLEFLAQTSDMRESARHLFQTLVSAYRSGLEAMMKCLFMSSSRLEFVEDDLEEDEILEISMDSHHTGQYPEWLRHEPLQLEFD